MPTQDKTDVNIVAKTVFFVTKVLFCEQEYMQVLDVSGSQQQDTDNTAASNILLC